MKDLARFYRESAVRSASPVGLIVILYEETIRSLRKAQTALKQKNIEQRTLELTHAIKVIGHLQSVLDFERGGAVARNLWNFLQCRSHRHPWRQNRLRQRNTRSAGCRFLERRAGLAAG